MALKGPVGVIRNNRLHHALDKYEFLFKECNAGSANLTRMVSQALGKNRVAPPEDVLCGKQFDMLDKKVFERMKKEDKERTVFFVHFAPPCRTFSQAQAQHQYRSKNAPYGGERREGEPVPDKVLDDSTIAVRCLRRCKLRHEIGDAFGLEHTFPPLILQLESAQTLLAMPGVYYFVWSNCAFGEKYQHKQIYLTNVPWLAPLARDCPGGHEHLGIGFGKELSTKSVEAYALGWCREFAKLFKQFVNKPTEDTCVHCLPNVSPNPTVMRETIRRCAEKVALDASIDEWVYELHQDSSGEVVIRAKAQSEALMSLTTNPGARGEELRPPQKFHFASQNRVPIRVLP